MTASLVTNLIVNCNLPVSIVDNEHFRKFLSDIDCKDSPPCRQTVTNSNIPQAASEKKTSLHMYLESVNHVTLTADVWTDRRQHSFLGVTVHTFINKHPASYLLAFRHFDGSHTGQRIADEMDMIINEFSLQGKVRYIVTDNASNMKKAMCILFEESGTEIDPLNNIDMYFDDASLWQDYDDIDDAISAESVEAGKRLPCFAHSLQLVIRDGLEANSVGRLALSKVSKLANLIHQSALFRCSFETTFSSGKSIPETNATRWNSVLRQHKAVLEFDQQKLATLLRDTNHGNLAFTKKDIEQLEEFVSILMPFAEATDLCQGEKTITISCVVPVVLLLNRVLGEMAEKVKHFQTLVSTLQIGNFLFYGATTSAFHFILFLLTT